MTLSTSAIDEHSLIKVKINDLKFDKSNPNQLTREQMAGLRESMQKFGYLTPIIIDQDMNIADGEHRALIYKEFSIDEIPAYQLNLHDDTERRILRQVMNKLHGEHDKQLDADELALIFQNNKLDELTTLIAAQKEDLQRLVLRYHPALDFVTPENQDDVDRLIDEELKRNVPDTKLGDIYQLGRHRLICADCSDKRSIDRLLEGLKAELLLTDPPYGISIVKVNGGTIGASKPITITGRISPRKQGNNKILDANPYIPIIGDDKPFDPSPILGLAQHHILFGANYYADKLPISSGWIVWLKKHEEWDRSMFADCELAWTDFDMPARVYRVIWFGLIKEGEHGARIHPTQKPVRLMANLINDFTEENNNIIDCYAGSGSTIIACEQTNRSCYAMEIDPHYCDVTVKRWETYTGKKAVKLSND